MQICCDGGYSGGKGAASIVVFMRGGGAGEQDVMFLGARGIFLSRAESAFQAEIIAAELGVDVAMAAATVIRHERGTKRVRFC